MLTAYTLTGKGRSMSLTGAAGTGAPLSVELSLQTLQMWGVLVPYPPNASSVPQSLWQPKIFLHISRSPRSVVWSLLRTTKWSFFVGFFGLFVLRQEDDRINLYFRKPTLVIRLKTIWKRGWSGQAMALWRCMWHSRSRFGTRWHSGRGGEEIKQHS